MISEILLVLSGHPSSFFVPHPSDNPTTLRATSQLEKYLHPGEIATLNSLSHLAFQYKHIKTWATSAVLNARRDLLDIHKKGKGKERERSERDQEGCIYRSALGNTILDILKEYEQVIVDLEAKIIELDPGIVQDQKGYVPLSVLVATFSPWSTPLKSLSDLIAILTTTNPSPGELIDIISSQTYTGHPGLNKIYTTCLNRLLKLWITHLVVFILYGYAPISSTSVQPALGVDFEPDQFSPRHRMYRLDQRLLPKIGEGTRESILYVGRVSATLKREGREVPRSIIVPLREAFEGLVSEDAETQAEEEEHSYGGRGMGRESGRAGGGLKDLDKVVQLARKEIGEWLWKYILTGSQIIEALETYGNYFLTRRADHATSLIHELTKLHTSKILLSDQKSSSSVIRDTDLHLAWLRCSLGTSASEDKSLESLHLKFDLGPLRAVPSTTRPVLNRTVTGGTVDIFSTVFFGVPMTLHPTISWPLDLFITPQARSTYSEIHAYLFALRTTQQRILTAWKSITSSRTTGQSSQNLKRLEREVWGTLKLALFFLDELLSHFMVDIIDIQHRTLLSQLDPPVDEANLKRSGSVATSLRGSTRLPNSQSREQFLSGLSNDGRSERRPDSPASTYAPETVRSRIPPTPNRHTAHLDFLTLRQIHSRHLAFLRQGLLLTDRQLAGVVRDIMDVCIRLAGLIDRWGGSVEPRQAKQNTEPSEDIDQRVATLSEIKRNLHENLSDFFNSLVESQNPTSSGGDTSSGPSGSFSKTTRTVQMVQSSRIISRQTSFAGKVPSASNKAGMSKADIERSERNQEAENLMGRHIEQLLLRLDYNGVFTSWIAKEQDVTKEGMLAEGGI